MCDDKNNPGVGDKWHRKDNCYTSVLQERPNAGTGYKVYLVTGRKYMGTGIGGWVDRVG